MGGGYTAVFNTMANMSNAVWPNKGKVGTYLIVGAALVAGAMDVAAERYAAKPLPESTLAKDRAKFWSDKAAELSFAPTPLTVNIINQTGAVAAVPATPPSKYMMEEGNADLNTDCFSCASAHLAATKAALERARGAVKDGQCGADCRQWLGLAADESAALLSWDWTDERIARLPDHQRAVLTPRKAQVDRLFNDLMNSPQAVEINKAKSLLGESIRFTNAGDPMTHPEVYGRVKRSEEMLAAAERLDIDIFDIDTANKLRSVRQATGNKVDSPEALKETWKGAREVASRVNGQVFASMTPATLDDLTRRADDIWSGFKQDRLQAEDDRDKTPFNVWEHVPPGTYKTFDGHTEYTYQVGGVSS